MHVYVKNKERTHTICHVDTIRIVDCTTIWKYICSNFHTASDWDIHCNCFKHSGFSAVFSIFGDTAIEHDGDFTLVLVRGNYKNQYAYNDV